MYEFIDLLVVVLPTAIALLSVYVSIKLTRGEPHRVWWGITIVLGIGASVLTWMSQSHARKEHESEIGQQNHALDTLRTDIQQNTIKNAADLGYLKAKLEDAERMNDKLSQFAPAILKLAQASAEFTRKQYEAKITSDKELYDFTMDVVKHIRAFSHKYRVLEEQQIEERMNASRQASTEAERIRLWNEANQKDIQLYFSRDQEFRNSLLPDAIYARNELLKRKIPEPPQTPIQKSTIDMVLRGGLAGPYPELEFATYLELMAKPLSSRN